MKTLAKLAAASVLAASLFAGMPSVTVAQESPEIVVCAECQGPDYYIDCIEYSNDPGYYHCTRYEGSSGNWTAVAYWRKNKE